MRASTLAVPFLLATGVLAAGCAADVSPAEDCEGGKCDEGVMGNCGPVLDRSVVPSDSQIITVRIGVDGRPVSQHTALASGGSALSEYVGYDSKGHLEKELWTRYDDAGGVLTRPGFGYTFAYAGDRLSERRELLDSFGETTHYSYTDAGDILQAKISTPEPDSEKLVDYQANHNDVHGWLELVETKQGGNAVTQYTFDKRSPAEWPASIRIGDSAMGLGTTIPVDHSLISVTHTESFRTETTFFVYDSENEDYLIRADDEDGRPVFFVSYECAESPTQK